MHISPPHSQRRPLSSILAAKFLVGAVAAFLALTGCGVGMGSVQNFNSAEPINVGVIPVADFAPVYIALDQGYFEDEGLDVETQVMSNAAAIAPSVMNGQLQFGTTAVAPFLTAVQQGVPLKGVSNAASTSSDPAEDFSAILVQEDSEMERLRDLEGKTVAVNALNSIVHFTAAAAIAEDGGDPSKVTFVAMPFPDMNSALGRGAIDAASVVEPFVTMGSDSGFVTLSHPNTEALHEGGTFALFFTAGPFAEANPEVVEKFGRAIDRASRAAAQEPELVRNVLQEHGGMPPEVSTAINLPLYTDDLNAPAIQHVADLMNELDFLESTLEAEGALLP